MCQDKKGRKFGSFFTETEDSRLAICVVCSKEAPLGGDNIKVYATTNLVYHLKSKHLEEYKKYEELRSDEQQGSSTKGKGSKEVQLKATNTGRS